jgi:hypothetical protein
MMLKHLVAAAAFAAAGLAASAPASAAPVSGPAAPLALAGLMDAKPLVTPVQYRCCRHTYRLCRYRWGYGWRFRRCMRIRGCY